MKNAISKTIWTANAALAGVIALAMASAIATPAPAQAMSASQKDQIEQRVQQASKRLDLTSQQKEQVVPILKTNMRNAMNILKRYGFSNGNQPSLSFRQKRKLGGELKANRKATHAKLSRILSSSQMATYKQMQDENRNKMRQRIQG